MFLTTFLLPPVIKGLTGTEYLNCSLNVFFTEKKIIFSKIVLKKDVVHLNLQEKSQVIYIL